MARAHADRPLSPRQTRFVSEYLMDLNATQAATRAGYSPRTAEQQGYHLLQKPSVAAALEVSADAVVRQTSAIASFDPGQLFGADGRLRPIWQLAADVRTAIAAIEYREDGTVKRLRFWDKVRASELLMRHLGLFEADRSGLSPDAMTAKALFTPERLARLSDEDLATFRKATSLAKRLMNEGQAGALPALLATSGREP